MTIEELEKVKFKFHSHMSMEDEHTTTYFSEDGKIGFCNHVPFPSDGRRDATAQYQRILTNQYIKFSTT